MEINKQVQKYLDEMADAQVEVDSQKDLMKTIIENAEENCDVDKAEFREAAKLYYLKKYFPEKFDKQQAKTEIVTAIAEIDV